MTVQATQVSPGSSVRIGRALARARQGRSGESVAKAAGISRRTLIKIEQGDSGVAIGNYMKVANLLGCPWLIEVMTVDNTGAGRVPRYYLTGASALSLPGPHHSAPALWYSSALQNPQTWQIAGARIVGANELLGVTGLWDATRTLASLGIEVEQLWAASPERALFDLLYHYCERKGKSIPNIQASDIDDVVDLDQVTAWIGACANFLSPEGIRRMRLWLGEGYR